MLIYLYSSFYFEQPVYFFDIHIHIYKNIMRKEQANNDVNSVMNSCCYYQKHFNKNSHKAKTSKFKIYL